jgi:hypothetical protein
MPDLTPATSGPFNRCSHGGCVDVKRHDDGVTLTSTIDGNDGVITYTHTEWATFLTDAKAGRWDHTAP